MFIIVSSLTCKLAILRNLFGRYVAGEIDRVIIRSTRVQSLHWAGPQSGFVIYEYPFARYNCVVFVNCVYQCNVFYNYNAITAANIYSTCSSYSCRVF